MKETQERFRWGQRGQHKLEKICMICAWGGERKGRLQ